ATIRRSLAIMEPPFVWVVGRARRPSCTLAVRACRSSLPSGPMPDQPNAAEVLLFWFGPEGERGKRRKRWFEKSEAFDREVRERFLSLYEAAARGYLEHWKDRAADCLALILVLDQFPRNMFRGTARAFATDAAALAAARHSLAQGYDRDFLPVERLFAY